MTKRSIGPRTLLYPHPDLIIGTYGPGGRPDAMAAAWGGLCSSRPPAVAVSVQKTRQTYENLIERREFTSLGKEAPCASGRRNCPLRSVFVFWSQYFGYWRTDADS